MLRTCCPPELVESLHADDGLRAFARLPEREHHRLVEMAKHPEALLTLAYTFSGEIVGEVSMVPVDSWWEGLDKTYEIAIQVSSHWRGLGLAHQLLTSALSFDTQEERVILGMGLSWHWDMKGLGLAPLAYRQFIEQLFASYGFSEYLTSEPNIRMDPANIFIARIGRRVDQKATNQFLNRLLVGPSHAGLAGLL